MTKVQPFAFDTDVDKHGATGTSEIDGLTLLAAGSTGTKAIAPGHDAFRELLHNADDSCVKRLQHAGFTAEQAQRLSDLHTELDVAGMDKQGTPTCDMVQLACMVFAGCPQHPAEQRAGRGNYFSAAAEVMATAKKLLKFQFKTSPACPPGLELSTTRDKMIDY